MPAAAKEKKSVISGYNFDRLQNSTRLGGRGFKYLGEDLVS